jgi:hypothetical protein
MAVNRPVCEQDIGFLGLEQPPKLLVMSRVDNRVPIALRREDGAGFQYFAGLSSFRDPYPAAQARIFFRTPLLATIQVQQDDVMSQIRVARNRAAASILGIARMAAANYDLELSGWLCKSASDRSRGYRPDQ